MAKGWNLKWLIGSAVVLVAVGATAAYTWSRPIAVSVAPVEKNVPIQVFGLGTVEAQTVSRIGFETAGTLVELNADHGDTRQGGHSACATAQPRAGSAGRPGARRRDAGGGRRRAGAIGRREGRGGAQSRRRRPISAAAATRGARCRSRSETADDTQAAADVAKADLSQARSAVSVARANLEQAKALLALEEARLAKYSLYAPYDAIVMTRHRELGSALNANEPRLHARRSGDDLGARLYRRGESRADRDRTAGAGDAPLGAGSGT